MAAWTVDRKVAQRVAQTVVKKVAQLVLLTAAYSDIQSVV